MIIPYPYDRTGAGATIPSGGTVLGERGVFTWLKDGKLYQRAMELDGVFLNSAKVRSMAVLSDGTARNTTVHTGGTQTILNGGVAEGVTVTVGGRVFVSSGGAASDVSVNSGATATVSSGGLVSGCEINAYRSMALMQGGTAATRGRTSFQEQPCRT